MKFFFKYGILMLLFCLGLKSNYNQDQKAYRDFNYNLSIIKKRINKKPWQRLNAVESAIKFLEKVTGITSHSNGNYIGRFDPTKEDYSNWKNWFEKNKNRLYWDEKEKAVKVSSLH